MNSSKRQKSQGIATEINGECDGERGVKDNVQVFGLDNRPASSLK